MAFVVLVGFQAYALIVPMVKFIGISKNQPGNVTETQKIKDSAGMGIIDINPTRAPLVSNEGILEPTLEPTQVILQENLQVTAEPTQEILQNGAVDNDDLWIQTHKLVRVVGRYSNYWPPYGGINCSDAGECSKLSNGEYVSDVIMENRLVAACPPELQLGTRFIWPPGTGLEWECMDRGESVKYYMAENGTPIYWFDFMVPEPYVDYGSYILVDMWVPKTPEEMQNDQNQQ